MNLTAEQLEQLQKKNTANIISKLKAGKTLTAREDRILQEHRAGAAPAEQNWMTLADAAIELGVSRRSISKWKRDFTDFPDPRPNGEYELAALYKFKEKHTLGRDATEDGEENDTEFSKQYWDRRRARADYETTIWRLDVEKQKFLPAGEITAAVGQMLAGFRTALNTLPTSAARWLIGLRDFNAIRNKLQEEVDAVLQALGRCDYLNELTASVVNQLYAERDEQFRAELTSCVDAVYQELGRLSLSDLLQRSLPAPTEPSTSQATDRNHTSPVESEQHQTESTQDKPSRKRSR